MQTQRNGSGTLASKISPIELPDFELHAESSEAHTARAQGNRISFDRDEEFYTMTCDPNLTHTDDLPASSGTSTMLQRDQPE